MPTLVRRRRRPLPIAARTPVEAPPSTAGGPGDGDPADGALDGLLEQSRALAGLAARWVGAVESTLSEADARLHLLDASTRTSAEAVAAVAGAAEQMTSATSSEVANTRSVVSEGLTGLSEAVRTKATSAQQVLERVRVIAQSIDLLALNAHIEAARVGAVGAGFKIVANEVRELARQVRDSVALIDAELDFGDLEHLSASLESDTHTALGSLQEQVERSLRTQAESIRSIEGELGTLAENHLVVREITDTTSLLTGRIASRVGLLERTLGATADAWSGGPSQLRSTAGQLLPHGMERDVLERVRRERRLRVAIEPSFVGLSWSRRPGGPLEGLDVEYAEAFAQWLGVACVFVPTSWDECIDRLRVPAGRGEAPADLVWSALPPAALYRGVAYSQPYTYLECALTRRCGDTSISDIASLDGRVLGCINDPGVFATLVDAGVRWSANRTVPGGRARVQNLVAFSDQSRLHDALANGTIDALVVDRPIVHWAATDAASPWHGRIEVLPGNVAAEPWYYAVAARAEASSWRLLDAVDRFLAEFVRTPERRAIEVRWQGQPVPGTRTHRDEDGGLLGAADLEARYHQTRTPAPTPTDQGARP